MKSLFPLFASIFTVLLVTSCDKLKTNAENEELKRKVDQLEQEKREADERRQAATEEELGAARDQLKLALEALEKEQAKAAEKPEVDLKNAGKAVVVPEPGAGKDPNQVAGGDDYRVFFNELAPFGEWFATEDYGYMWQPQVARKERGWHPYTRGRWLLAEEGWTWVSEEPFGWATFHYGRWALLERHGWAWVPGDQWAPSWVSWRQSEEYVGWAPLPPETLYNQKHAYTGQVDTIYDLAPSWYSFVPVARFQDSIAPHCVPPQQVMAIVARSENVTDVRTRADGIYSGGPNERWLASHLGGRVQRASIARHRERTAGGRHEQFQGGKLNLFAPAVGAAWNPAVRPQNISEKWGRISVVRGGGAMDQWALARYRADNLARQEAARRAIEREEVQEALLRDRRWREEAVRQASRQCSVDVHGQLERAFTRAQQDMEEAQARLAQPNLNPKQRAYAELTLQNARKSLLAAEGPYLAHMRQFHADEWARAEAVRMKAEAERIALEEARRRQVCQPSEHELLETAYQAARAQAAAAEREVSAPNLNPKQLSFARVRLDESNKKLAAAERPYLDHLLKHHPDDYRRMIEAEARVKAERSVAEERGREESLAKEKAARAAEEVARQEKAARAAAAEEAVRQAEAAKRVAEAEAARKAEMEAQARAEAEQRARDAAAQAKAAAQAEAAKRVEEERRKGTVCDPAEHRQLEAAYDTARAEFKAAQAKMNAPNLNPKQLAYARQIAEAAGKKQSAVEQAFLAHLEKHHAQDHKRLLTERAQESARQLAEDQARESKRLAEERVQEELERARLAEERTAALAKAEAERLAQEKLKEEELKRQAAAREQELAAAKARREAARNSGLPRRSPAPDPNPVPAPVPGAKPVPVCSPAVHSQLESALKAAQTAVDLAQSRVDAPNANPRQLSYARTALGAATQKLQGATVAYEAHMQEFHPAEWEEILAERAAAAKKAKEEEEKAEKGKKD